MHHAGTYSTLKCSIKEIGKIRNRCYSGTDILRGSLHTRYCIQNFIPGTIKMKSREIVNFVEKEKNPKPLMDAILN
jgi:hypothetical protein